MVEVLAVLEVGQLGLWVPLDDDHELVGVALLEAAHLGHPLLEGVPFLIRLKHDYAAGREEKAI